MITLSYYYQCYSAFKRNIATGTFALPGGHLEFQESFEDCAARELEEETGISVLAKDVHFVTCTNNILHQDSGKHYVTIFMAARLPSGQQPQVCFDQLSLGVRLKLSSFAY